MPTLRPIETCTKFRTLEQMSWISHLWSNFCSFYRFTKLVFTEKRTNKVIYLPQKTNSRIKSQDNFDIGIQNYFQTDKKFWCAFKIACRKEDFKDKINDFHWRTPDSRNQNFTILVLGRCFFTSLYSVKSVCLLYTKSRYFKKYTFLSIILTDIHHKTNDFFSQHEYGHVVFHVLRYMNTIQHRRISTGDCVFYLSAGDK